MKSPYRNVLDEHDGEKIRNQIRWRKTIEFIEKSETRFFKIACLDIGDRSMLTGRLERLFRSVFTNTNVDLDVVDLSPPYEYFYIITCFEVIEHLFNPLHCLLGMRKKLMPGGRIYLSTPRHKPHSMWGNHFHEMSDKSLFALLDRAGLRVVRRKKIFIMPLRSLLTGIRPWLRLIFDRVWLFELEAKGK